MNGRLMLANLVREDGNRFVSLTCLDCKVSYTLSIADLAEVLSRVERIDCPECDDRVRRFLDTISYPSVVYELQEGRNEDENHRLN